ncbi:hypothetical protein EHO58_19440 [Leptospira selangorensis]|nr:hypothetical protein EHO58_19440 [Leptospira selangorensis]
MNSSKKYYDEFQENIPNEHINYNEKTGEINIELSKGYAYFIHEDYNYSNFISEYVGEIRLESLFGKISYSGLEVQNAFSYDKDCDCYLWKLKRVKRSHFG